MMKKRVWTSGILLMTLAGVTACGSSAYKQNAGSTAEAAASSGKSVTESTTDSENLSNSAPGTESDGSTNAAYSLVFEDNFDGETVDPENWRVCTTDFYQYRRDRVNTIYDSQNVSIISDDTAEDGKCLQLHASIDSDTHFRGAQIFSAGLRQWKYGRIEARIKSTQESDSACSAFWTCGYNNGYIYDYYTSNESPGYGDWTDYSVDHLDHAFYNTWAETGELDILENEISASAGHTDGFGHATLHYYDYQTDEDGAAASIGSNSFADSADDWHVYRADWDANSIRIYYDDQLIGEQDISGDAFQAFQDYEQFIVLTSSGLGSYAPDISQQDTWSHDMFVDYVRVYQTDEGTYNETVDDYETIPVIFSITQGPDKTEYQKGESFSPEGLTARIYYSDGTYKDIQADDCDYEWNTHYPGSLDSVDGSQNGDTYEAYVVCSYKEQGVKVSSSLRLTIS